MKELLIDSTIIIDDPRVLGLVSSDYKLCTTPSVIDSITTSGNPSNISYSNRLSLIENAVKLGSISVVQPTNDEIEYIQHSITSPRLSISEKNILAYILFQNQKGNKIFLTTKSKIFKKIASNYGVDIFSTSDLDMILDTVPKRTPVNHDIFSQIEEYERKEKGKIFWGIVIGILLSIGAIEIYININSILAATNIWGTISLIIMTSFILYVIREKWRLPYGCLEFFVGVFSVVVNFYPSRFNFTELPFDSTLFIKIVGGLYIMVRGIDNIMIALKNTKFGSSFRRILVLNT